MTKNSGNIQPRYLIYGIVYMIFLGILFNWTLSTIIHSRKEVTVPNLVGKTLFESLELLEPLNLGMRKVAIEFDKNLPTGIIIRQVPYAGAVVREGKIIQITLALGGESVFMPQLSGLGLRQAEIKIRGAALTLGEVSKIFSLKYGMDYVIKQQPAAGMRIPKETTVNLTISAGAPPADVILMPDFVGQVVDSVTKWEQENGFKVNYIYEENFKQVGRVIRQSPEFDTVLTSTSIIQIVIGK